MIVGFFNGQIQLTDALLIVAIAGAIAKVIMDERGLTRSSKLLRAENADLLRRNGELEATVARHERRIQDQEIMISEQAANIVVLNERVRDLGERDQAAVLTALLNHESKAQGRYEKIKEGDENRHTEHVNVLSGIAANIQALVAGQAAAAAIDNGGAA